MTVAKVFDLELNEKLTNIKRFTQFSDMEARWFAPSKYATLGLATSYGTKRKDRNADEKYHSRSL